MKLDDPKNAVNGPQKKSRHTQMPPVVKKGQESRIHPAERTNAQNYMKQEKCRRTSGTNDQRFRCRKRKQQVSERDEDPQIRSDASEQNEVIHSLLSIPADGRVTVAHVPVPTGTEPSTSFCATLYRTK
jgi:hypothetical protein